MNLKRSILFVGLLFATSTTAVFAQTGNIRKAKTAIGKFEELKGAGTAALGKTSLTEAQTAIDEAVVHDKTKDNPEAWTFYSIIYANIASLDNNAEAAAKAKDGIAKATELDTDKKFAENIKVASQTLGQFKFNQGVASWDKQDYKTAYTDFSDALTYLPGDTTLTFYSGLAAVQNKDYDNAIEKYKALIPVKEYSSHKTVMVDLPKLYLSKGDTTSAIAAAQEAVTAYPNDNDAVVQNIELNLITGNEAKIVSDIEAQLAKDASNKNLHYYLGLAHSAAGNDEKALAAYQKAIELDPNYMEANMNAAVVIMNGGREDLMKLNEDKTLKQADYDKKLGEIKTKIAVAVPYLQKAVDIDPKNVDALKSLKSYYDFINDEAKSAELQAKINALN
ncbi:tetratricopeptide repeat protein [Sphingobacterium lactis]|uniref:Tetratricopeptide repeat-containing protein n=1 Tax=Sphingobacterium lactis TaxID=797291 RepID=A0A1H5Z7E5_9SPHI|nr:tetratricopeptide repeat protein [Sphingobacterium lactis]SEG31527.1 Tetratricopeptide repeat-containing protein [Sphingobacterium lactis]